MDRYDTWNHILDVLKAGPSLPAQRGRDQSKREAAEVRNRTAWQRVGNAAEGLYALLGLREELQRHIWDANEKIRDAGGLLSVSPEDLEELRLRDLQLREVLIAFLSQGKVFLDLLAQAVATALGSQGGFQEKHGSLGKRLDEFAAAAGVTSPPSQLVERAHDLDRRIADVRDDVIVHPKLSGEHARRFVSQRGSDLEIRTLFPADTEVEPPVIAIDELDVELNRYVRELTTWLASALRDFSP